MGARVAEGETKSQNRRRGTVAVRAPGNFPASDR